MVIDIELRDFQINDIFDCKAQLQGLAVVGDSPGTRWEIRSLWHLL